MKLLKNYNGIVILLVVLIILTVINVSVAISSNRMYREVNYNNNVNNQIVNVNTGQEKEKININKCSFEALDSLPGIGTTKAKEIIDRRNYKDIYEIKKIIGDHTFDNIKNLIET